MTSKREIVKSLASRAKALILSGKWNENEYWLIKEKLLEHERFWDLEKPRFYWDWQLKADLAQLHFILEEVWRMRFKTIKDTI